MSRLKVAIAGATGRMGRMLVEAALDADDIELAGALEVAGNPAIGRDAGEFLGRSTGVSISASIDEVLANADFLIDFTRPAGTLAHLESCVRHRVGAVIGTTGFDDAGRLAIESAARTVPIVFAPNMSVGVNVTFKLLELAARILSTGYDIEVIEAHHRHKVDAPSGTALRMGEVIAQALGRNLDEVGVFARHAVDLNGFSATGGAVHYRHCARRNTQRLRQEPNDFFIRLAFNRRRCNSELDCVAVQPDHFRARSARLHVDTDTNTTLMFRNRLTHS